MAKIQNITPDSQISKTPIWNKKIFCLKKFEKLTYYKIYRWTKRSNVSSNKLYKTPEDISNSVKRCSKQDLFA